MLGFLVLPPNDIVHFQLVSKRFLQIARDDNLWKILCFENTQPETLRKRREVLSQDLRQAVNEYAQTLLSTTEYGPGNQTHPVSDLAVSESDTVVTRRRRALANWDPSYGLDRINWYEDYIHRHAPISLGWLQQPCARVGNAGQLLEARGLSVLTESIDKASENQPLVVAPLDDGSVCLWSLQHSESRHTYGSIIGQSEANLLGPMDDLSQKQSRQPSKSWRNTLAVSQSVSVDNIRRTAFFAVENLLTEVDLHTLQCVSRRQFPGNIAAISEGSPFLPLTVGTHGQLYLHDPRVRKTLDLSPLGNTLHCDPPGHIHASEARYGRLAQPLTKRGRLDYSPLLEPGPVSILHVPHSGGARDINDAVYVAGCFPSILYYDRRMWPQLSGAIYSGSRLSGLAHVPGLVKAVSQGFQYGASGEANKARTEGSGKTLIACGEYKGRGSLELYGLSPNPAHAGSWSGGKPSQMSTVKNRHTASRSKLLSVALHGTRIVYSDGDGFVKWVENDGSSEVRQWSLNQKVKTEPHRLFSGGADSGDVVRKIIPTRAAADKGEHQVNDSQLLVWTGERIGVLSFSRRSVVKEAFEWGAAGLAAEVEVSEEQRIYSQRMRNALERQADEARFMRGLGLGLS